MPHGGFVCVCVVKPAVADEKILNCKIILITEFNSVCIIYTVNINHKKQNLFLVKYVVNYFVEMCCFVHIHVR